MRVQGKHVPTAPPGRLTGFPPAPNRPLQPSRWDGTVSRNRNPHLKMWAIIIGSSGTQSGSAVRALAGATSVAWRRAASSIECLRFVAIPACGNAPRTAEQSVAERQRHGSWAWRGEYSPGGAACETCTRGPCGLSDRPEWMAIL